ncbi:MAG TPA: hypothetical protein VJL89_12295 [Thermodesulfovibrionia bacterium]|nr:hypothetical protein [Thermodesulfovibrionia bacterium]
MSNYELKVSLSEGSVEDLAQLTWEYWGEDEKNPQKIDGVSVKAIGSEKALVVKPNGEISSWTNLF